MRECCDGGGDRWRRSHRSCKEDSDDLWSSGFSSGFRVLFWLFRISGQSFGLVKSGQSLVKGVKHGQHQDFSSTWFGFQSAVVRLSQQMGLGQHGSWFSSDGSSFAARSVQVNSAS
ncbi:hypothetical protein Hanom_Chr17g01527701 [Helianthus anomalus]